MEQKTENKKTKRKYVYPIYYGQGNAMSSPIKPPYLSWMTLNKQNFKGQFTGCMNSITYISHYRPVFYGLYNYLIVK